MTTVEKRNVSLMRTLCRPGSFWLGLGVSGASLAHGEFHFGPRCVAGRVDHLAGAVIFNLGSRLGVTSVLAVCELASG